MFQTFRELFVCPRHGGEKPTNEGSRSQDRRIGAEEILLGRSGAADRNHSQTLQWWDKQGFTMPA